MPHTSGKGTPHHCPGETGTVDGYPGNCRRHQLGYCMTHENFCNLHSWSFMKSRKDRNKQCPKCERAARIAERNRKKDGGESSEADDSDGGEPGTKGGKKNRKSKKLAAQIAKQSKRTGTGTKPKKDSVKKKEPAKHKHPSASPKKGPKAGPKMAKALEKALEDGLLRSPSTLEKIIIKISKAVFLNSVDEENGEWATLSFALGPRPSKPTSPKDVIATAIFEDSIRHTQAITQLFQV